MNNHDELARLILLCARNRLGGVSITGVNNEQLRECRARGYGFAMNTMIGYTVEGHALVFRIHESHLPFPSRRTYMDRVTTDNGVTVYEFGGRVLLVGPWTDAMEKLRDTMLDIERKLIEDQARESGDARAIREADISRKSADWTKRNA